MFISHKVFNGFSLEVICFCAEFKFRYIRRSHRMIQLNDIHKAASAEFKRNFRWAFVLWRFFFKMESQCIVNLIKISFLLEKKVCQWWLFIFRQLLSCIAKNRNEFVLKSKAPIRLKNASLRIHLICEEVFFSLNSILAIWYGKFWF